MIGGLFSTITALVFIANSYNNLAYEISLGSAVFKPENEKEIRNFKNYNFFSYVKQCIYSFLNFFGYSPGWKSTTEYN